MAESEDIDSHRYNNNGRSMRTSSLQTTRPSAAQRLSNNVTTGREIMLRRARTGPPNSTK
jgi:hypothetical protein